MTTEKVDLYLTLPKELADAFEALVGKRNQSKEIAEMIEEWIHAEQGKAAVLAPGASDVEVR